MWKKVNFNEFLEKHGVKLNNFQNSEKIKISEKSQSDNRLKEKNLIVNSEKSIQSISVKKIKKEPNKRLGKKVPASIRFRAEEIIDNAKKKGILFSDGIIITSQNSGVFLYNQKDKIQIYQLAKELKRLSPTVITTIFEIEGLENISPWDLIDNVSADKFRSLFFSKSKKSKLSEGNQKNQKPDEKVSRVVSKEKIISKPSQNVFKFCQYCSVNIRIEKYDLHIKEKCPQRSKYLTLENFKKEELPKPNNPIKIENPAESSFKKLQIERVHWKLLPQGEWLFSEVTNHFKKLSQKKKWRNKSFDENRLLKIERTLKPNRCFIGNDEFEGYIVYCFDWTTKVILECPIYGNAIYIIKQGEFTWQEIAKATKWEARTKYSEQIKVINHSETWIMRLNRYLRYGF